jgi:aspartate/methionine/tyrosine aminotransferase
MVSKRVQSMAVSTTLHISALANEMRAAGHDVLDFSAGQPDFPTPDVVMEAGKKAIEAGHTRYTANPGIVELRKEIALGLERDHGLTYAADQIIVSSGAKASLFFACMAILDPGDEVLVPLPYWVSYPEQVRLAQAVPVFVPCLQEDGFKLSIDGLRAALTPRTKILMLNYPSNPTGACYSREELEPIAEFCVENGLWVIADEIYDKLVFDGRQFTSIAEIGDEIRSRSIVIKGVSKTYSMTGWRIGYAAGPKEIITGISKMQSHSTSNACSISQWASLAALQSGDEEINRRVREFENRRDEIVKLARRLEGFSCRVPDGAFYLFPNVSPHLKNGAGGGGFESVNEMAKYLLERAQVATVPGDAFGSDEHIRLSFAVSADVIREGMGRIAEALAALPGD